MQESKIPDIIKYFDNAAVNRNKEIASDPIVDYEQKTRSAMVIGLLNPQKGEKILEIGCGNARDLTLISVYGCHCVGIDISPGMLDEARHDLAAAGISDVELEVGSATALRFADATFDKVFASEVIEHIPEYEKCIAEMARVVKPGGSVVITTPNRRSWYGFDRYILFEGVLRQQWKHPYDSWKTYVEVAGTLERAGLTVTTVRGICYVPGFLIPLIFLRFFNKIIVHITALAEPILSLHFPKKGYMLGLLSKKKHN